MPPVWVLKPGNRRIKTKSINSGQHTAKRMNADLSFNGMANKFYFIANLMTCAAITGLAYYLCDNATANFFLLRYNFHDSPDPFQ